jgi:hypothetical protein
MPKESKKRKKSITYKQYTPVIRQKAIQTLVDNITERPKESINKCTFCFAANVSINNVAKRFNVPVQTLHRELTKRMKSSKKLDEPMDLDSRRYLSEAEEKLVVAWVLYLADSMCYCPRSVVNGKINELRMIRDAEPVVLKSKWWKKFLRRHPELTERVPSTKSTVRTVSCTVEVFTMYWVKLDGYIK